MNFEPDIELYATREREVLYEQLLSGLGETGVVKVEKKLSMYQQMTFETLLRTGTLDFINGSDPRLYELKIKSLKTPVRFVCSIERRKLILLDVLFESGSKGAIEKCLPRSAVRLADWRVRNLA